MIFLHNCMYNRLQKISILFYFVSLFTPIFKGSDAIGILALLTGWMGYLTFFIYHELPSIDCLAWTANIIYFSIFFFSKKKKNIRVALSLITLIFGLLAFNIKKVEVDIEGTLGDVTPGFGFFCWLVSFVLMFIYNLNLERVNGDYKIN